jgi:hypothetical protein
MDKTYKIATTPQLIEINRRSRRNKYNRTLDSTLTLLLDPQGIHVQGSIVLPHEHAQGVKVDPHWRVQLMVKLVGDDKPTQLFLDMTDDDYRSLVTVDKDGLPVEQAA